ncbi:hypothetical protein [Oscillatoria salina]|nr:hypothetical protein [Oscillatoria salina]
MIQGYFGNNGELYFEIELVTADREIIAVDALAVKNIFLTSTI